MPPRSTLSPDQIEELRREAASWSGPRSAWAEERARLLNVHTSTIYRAVANVTPARKRRSDAGGMRALSEDDFRVLGAMVVQYDYDAQLAIDTLNANRAAAGLAELEIHPETLRRHLRERGVSRRDNTQDLRPHRRWEAPHPGYLWQIDSTCAAQYYVDTDRSIGYEQPHLKNKNKEGNQRSRVWLIGVVDDYTRVRWARFYTGNDAFAWQDVLFRCMAGFADPARWPAFGVPQRIYSDQDAAMKSAVMTKTLQALQVERLLALPSTAAWTNAQAKGKVERTLGVLVQGFEKVTRWSRFPSIDAMNAALLEHLVWLNNRIHSGTRCVPFERWLEADQVIQLPAEELLRRLRFHSVERVITSGVEIHLDSTKYQLPHRRPFVDHIGRKVEVRYREGEGVITVVLAGEEHEIAAVTALPDAAGDFKGSETPGSVLLKKELLRPELLKPLDPHLVRGFRNERDQRTYPIRPAVVPHPLTAEQLDVRMVKRGPAVDRLQAAGAVATPPTPAERALLDALFGGRGEIPESDLRQFITDRTTPGAAITPLRAERA
jgi:hypothetical protein